MYSVARRSPPIWTARSRREFSLYKNSKASARAAAIGDCLNSAVLTADLRDTTLYIIEADVEYSMLPAAFSTGSVSSKLTIWKLSDVIGRIRKHIYRTYMIYTAIMFVAGMLMGVLLSKMLR